MPRAIDAVKVDDRVWRRLLARAHGLDRAHVKVGVLASEDAPDNAEGITMVELAAIHEFGSPAAGVPERSFIRSTFRAREGDGSLGKICERLAREVVTRGMPVSRALGLLGQWGAAEVKKTIVEKQTEGPEDQANAPSTVARKGSSTPLVDTGRLLGSVTYQVSEGGE